MNLYPSEDAMLSDAKKSERRCLSLVYRITKPIYL